MAKRIGTDTVLCESQPQILSSAAIVGKKEGEGPLQEHFDVIHEDTTLCEKSWEKAESRMQSEALTRALDKAVLAPADVQYVFAGDLLNQCIGSAFGLRSTNIPFLGQYGACSTMAQTLAMAALFVEGGIARTAAAVTSSHFCSAERQFRFPLEYGGVRAPTSQWTVTGSGAAIVGHGEDEDCPKICAVTVGRIVDLGIKDANNMGAAMAPAASTTIAAFLKDTATRPEDYDLILTGDLGYTGSQLLIDLLKRENIDIHKNHADCGLLIYDREKQDVKAGGSGCGCAGSVLCSYVMHRLRNKDLHNILFIATGALMSTTSSQQGESIPGIAHLLNIRA